MAAQLKPPPIEACRFSASFDMPASETSTAGDVPFTALVRSGEVVNDWYWGRAIHDFSGMAVAATIPVDYCHDSECVIGVCDKVQITKDGLRCGGYLKPFREGDLASEIIHKSRPPNPVPYQSSILFDPNEIVLEEVPAGMSAEVNGINVDGPVSIFRQWKLLGFAICPYGRDSNTNMTISGFNRRAAEGRFTSKGEVMPGQNGETETQETTDETKVQKTEGEEAASENATEEETAQESAETKPGDQPPNPTDGKFSRKAEAERFQKAFGEHAAGLFIRGLSFEEAQGEFTRTLQEENDRLKKQNAHFSRGQFSGQPLPAGEMQRGLEAAREAGGFAKTIKLPGK